MKSISSSNRNLQIYTGVSSVWAVVFGLIGPFYVVQVETLSEGFDKLGISFSIMVLCQSFTSYYAGRFSDVFGRKPFLFFIAYTDAAVLLLYTVIDQTYQLYILQGLFGITNGVADTISTSLLGDLTQKKRRGKTVGKFNAIVSLSSAAGLLVGGYVAKLYGIKILFYLSSAIVAFSTVFLLSIREEKKEGVDSGIQVGINT